MFTSTSTKNKKPIRNWEGLEAIKEFPSATTQVVKEESKRMLSKAWEQISGLEQAVQELSGELKAGESLDLTQVDQKEVYEPSYPEVKGYTQPGVDYHRDFARVNERPLPKEDTRQIQMRIDQIIVELRKLTNSSTELAVQFEEVTMEQAPQDAGTYHLNFFEWVFSVVQKARERIEESQTWLATFKSKKGQKSYWNMFQKHGTTFGLSGERVVATQTG